MATDTVLVSNVIGKVWMRTDDGSLIPVHEGMRVPANAHLITDNGSQVTLLADGVPPITIGEARDVALGNDMLTQPDAASNAVTPPSDPIIGQVLAALESGADPFANLEATAAVLSGGDGGGSSFSRLASVIEATSPLGLAYPRGLLGTPEDVILSGDGIGDVTAAAAPLPPSFLPPTITFGDGDSGAMFDIPESHLRPEAPMFARLSVADAGDTANASPLTFSYTSPAGLGKIVFTFTPEDGEPSTREMFQSDLDDLKNGGAPFEVDTELGLLLVTGYEPSTGTLTYVYYSDGSVHNVDGEPVPDTIAISIVDQVGQTVSGDLVANITDTAPIAVDDSVTMTEDNTAVIGNVIAGGAVSVDGVVDDTQSGAADTPSADGGTVVTGIANSAGTESSKVTSTGPGEVKGEFGTLTISNDGTYTYTRTANLQGMKEGDPAKTDVFTYTIVDGDGTEREATITINIAGLDDTTNVVIADAASESATSTVYESGLAGIGSAAATNGELATGTFNVGATDGITSVVIGGTTFALADLKALDADGTDVTVAQGTLTVLSYTSTDGDKTATIGYRYELTTPVGNDAPTADKEPGESQSSITVDVTVHGTEAGNSETGTLTVVIKDDAPIAADYLDVGTVTEDGKGAALVVDGHVMQNSLYGADGAGSVAWSGADIAKLADYGDLVLVKDADGHYTGAWSFTLNNDKAATQKLGATDTLPISLTYTITDSDGDPKTGTVSFAIQGAADTTSVVIVDAASEGATSTVHESGLAVIGSAAATDGELATGTFNVGATDGITSVVIGGTTFALADLKALDADGTAVAVGQGTLTVLSYTSADGDKTATIGYRYELTTPVLNATPTDDPALAESQSSVGIKVTVNGTEAGNSKEGTLTVTIIDDAPTISVDTQATGTYGSAITGSVAMAFGADGEKSVSVTLGSETVAGVKSGGNYTFTLADGKVVTLNGTTGDFSYNGVPASGAGTSYAFTFTVTDQDNDTASASTTATVAKTNTSGLSGTAASSDLDVAANADSDTTNNVTHAVTVAGLPAGAQLVAGTYSASTNYGQITVDASGNAAYQQTKLYTHTGAGADTKAAADSVTVTVRLGDGSTVDMVVKVGITDDVPTAFISDEIHMASVGQSVTEGLNFAANAGADGVGDVIFKVTDGAAVTDTNGASIFFKGEQVVYRVGSDPNVVEGWTDKATGSERAFTATLDPQTDTWSFKTYGSMFNGSEFTTRGAAPTGGNGDLIGFTKLTNPDTPNDLLVTAFKDGAHTSVNTNEGTFGVDTGQSITRGETIRFDFVTNAIVKPVNKPTVESTTYTDHYEVSSFTQLITSTKGTDIKIRVVNADNIGTFDGVDSTATGIFIVTVVRGGVVFKTFESNGGEFVLAELKEGDVFTVTAATDPFSAIEISGDSDGTFKLGSATFSTANTAEPFDIHIPITGKDGDGDTVDGSVTAHLYPGSSTLEGTSGNDSDLKATDTLLHVLGQDGNDTLTGIDGHNTVLIGGQGNDTLAGKNGNDTLDGGPGSDTLDGGAGNDILIGGAGSDILTGGAGDDVFVWKLGDQAAAGEAVPVDHVTDFGLGGSDPRGKDVLDLSDLLQGHSDTAGTHGPGVTAAGAADLTAYLNFSTTEGTGGKTSTVIDVSSNGHAADGKYDQQIVIDNVDLTGGVAGDINQAALIASLINDGKLKVDQG